MHDYMKALYHRFENPSERAEELEEVVDKAHKQLAKQLGKQQRRLLLRLGKFLFPLFGMRKMNYYFDM